MVDVADRCHRDEDLGAPAQPGTAVHHGDLNQIQPGGRLVCTVGGFGDS